MINEDKLFLQLFDHEGYRKSVYLDSKGYQTIAVGRLVDKRLNAGIELFEAKYLLKNDTDKKATELNIHLPWWQDLDEVRARAILDLTFNMGIGSLLKFKNTLKALKRKDYIGVEEGLVNSKWYRDVQKSRSTRIIRMLKEGVD